MLMHALDSSTPQRSHTLDEVGMKTRHATLKAGIIGVRLEMGEYPRRDLVEHTDGIGGTQKRQGINDIALSAPQIFEPLSVHQR